MLVFTIKQTFYYTKTLCDYKSNGYYILGTGLPSYRVILEQYSLVPLSGQTF